MGNNYFFLSLRYLEKGHTYNEGDSMHARIENSCKDMNVYTQEQWCEIMRTAKKNEPFYIVHELSQNEIYNFRTLADDQNWKAIKIMNLKEIFVFPNDTKVSINYEYSETSRSIIEIETKKSVGKKYPLVQAYDENISIDKDKKKDLVFMCETVVVPQEYHSFYEPFVK